MMDRFKRDIHAVKSILQQMAVHTMSGRSTTLITRFPFVRRPEDGLTHF